jgi:ubiquinone/menaquinone biosynthesis C-methylase UbiE
LSLCDSSLVSSYDGVADRYDATRGGEARGTEFAAMIEACLPPSAGQILDIGVGTGTVAFALQALGRQVVGVDLSMGMLTWALRRLGRRVAMADACALPTPTAVSPPSAKSGRSRSLTS